MILQTAGTYVDRNIKIGFNGNIGGQSDWQENDETSNAYILNRTHWLEQHEPLSENFNIDVTSNGILMSVAD